MSQKGNIYVSRFRLFHKGYLEVIKYILSRDNSPLIIAIGAAQTSHRQDNPFTGRERAEMITRTLREEGLLNRIEVIQIDETFATYENWTSLVESICPPFKSVYSNNELVRVLFQKAGYETREVPQFSRKEYSFEFIKDKIINYEPWEDFLPTQVAKVMKEYKLYQRLRRLYGKG